MVLSYQSALVEARSILLFELQPKGFGGGVGPLFLKISGFRRVCRV